MSWIDSPWLGFDTETTGIRPKDDRLVTAALVFRPQGAQKTQDAVRTWLADPDMEIPEQATAVHGISTAYARANGRPVAKVLDEVAACLAKHWRNGFPVVIYNAAYDVTLLEANLVRYGLPTLGQRLEGTPLFVVDPLVLDRHLDRYRKGKRTLTTTAPVYGVDADPDAHTAEVDVAMTLDVLQGICGKYTQLADMDAAQLMEYQTQAHKDWADNFNSYLQKQGKTGDISPMWLPEFRA